jgi:hypothetical protein
VEVLEEAEEALVEVSGAVAEEVREAAVEVDLEEADGEDVETAAAAGMPGVESGHAVDNIANSTVSV